jgi:serine/threonine protein kinase
MSKLRHPNIVALYGMILNPLRLVMEYCSHGDLFSALKKEMIWSGPVQLADAALSIPPLCWKIMTDIAHGMAFLHAQQPPIAHRDLRSPNVFLTSLDPSAPCCAKVADFGLSVAVTARQTVSLESWQWMAHEALLGANYTHLCDLYSFAIVAHELLTQQVPFSEYAAMRYLDRMRLLLSEGLRLTIPAFCPGWMRELLRALWQHEPNQRPSFAECVECLALQKRPRQDSPVVSRWTLFVFFVALPGRSTPTTLSSLPQDRALTRQ